MMVVVVILCQLHRFDLLPAWTLIHQPTCSSKLAFGIGSSNSAKELAALKFPSEISGVRSSLGADPKDPSAAAAPNNPANFFSTCSSPVAHCPSAPTRRSGSGSYHAPIEAIQKGLDYFGCKVGHLIYYEKNKWGRTHRKCCNIFPVLLGTIALVFKCEPMVRLCQLVDIFFLPEVLCHSLRWIGRTAFTSRSNTIRCYGS